MELMDSPQPHSVRRPAQRVAATIIIKRLDSLDLFETSLSIPSEELWIELRGFSPVPWSSFLLNPRRLRGSDFLMRWSQGVWSETRVTQAVNGTNEYLALPYGPSGVAPTNDVRAFERYFERLEQAGLGQIKRPDLLVFRKQDEYAVNEIVRNFGGTQELPFTPEEDENMNRLLSMATLAVECENSLWRAKQMPDYGSQLRPMKRLGGQPGLSKSAVLPTVILKDEDFGPLKRWQERNGIHIHIWHVFYDLAFGLALDAAQHIIDAGLIKRKEQVFYASSGATSRKYIYQFYYHYAYPVGTAEEEPALVAEHIADKNGHILPYVRFEGGSLVLSSEALQVLDEASSISRV